MRYTLLIILCFSTQLFAQDKNVDQSKKFEPNVNSLQNYTCPEWFRDAKFGIYVHWGVYSVAEDGEWYAREMYQEGSDVYNYHLKKYGHPSKFGYKDLIPLWKADHFDPDAWLTLFKEAGAKYFTPCAAHHDGFALWDSKYQKFNSVNMGPKMDIIKMLKDATLKHGLRFGVTTHFGRSLSWIQPSHGADTAGPYNGVPYDGNDPKYQDLYLLKYYDDNRADTENPPLMWREYWYVRIAELVDNYKPDFVYLDSAVPFAGEDNGKTGMRFLAHFYNQNMAWHSGNQEGVITHKGDKGPKRAPYFEGIATLDIERGKSRDIREKPWQTDDSIGPWGYTAGAAYKDPDAVIDKMIDVVSKNGNYLLNVPPKADGTFDDETIAILKGIGTWFNINGEGIYATRPWKVFGEGPEVEMHNRDNKSPYTWENIRFTQSKDGKTLYMIFLGWPGANKKLAVHAFAKGGPGGSLKIKKVSLLGSDTSIKWNQGDSGLKLNTPDKAPSELAIIYKLELEE